MLAAIPFPFLIARLFAGIDIRQHGSGNPGASNVFRVVGPGPGLLTFALDTGKGATAVCLADWLLGADWYLLPRICWRPHDVRYLWYLLLL